MPRRYIEAASIYVTMVFIGGITGIVVFCFGIFCIVVLFSLLHNIFGLSGELLFNLVIIAVLALIAFTLVSGIGLPIAYIIKRNSDIEKKYKGIRIANVDSMDGIEFEYYLQRLLTHQGYNVRVTKASGDLGVDLVATRSNERIAVQAKRYTGAVSRLAISDAVAGINYYRCNRAMVITNSYFSPGAVTLAQSTGCILIDRDTLAKWINEYQNLPS